MKKTGLLLLIFLLIFAVAPKGFCDSITNDLSKIESELFDITYSQNDVSKRLSRIEKNIYGTDFPKLTTEKRLAKIKADVGYAPPKSRQQIAQRPVQIQPSAAQRATKEQGEDEYPAVDKLEATVFKTTYKNENIYKRLDRLEQKVFGTTNQTSALSDRVYALRTVIKTSEDKVTKANSNKYNNLAEQSLQNHPQSAYTQQPRQLGRYSSNRNFDFEVGVLEQQLYGQSYNGQNVSQRLSRLEYQLLKRDYSSEDEASRIERLSTVILAQKTSSNYDSNKFKQFLSTGMQVGSLVLLILAMIF